MSSEIMAKAKLANDKADKADFRLLVQLLLREGVPSSQVNFRAWLEGRAGLERRLAALQPSLPGV